MATQHIATALGGIASLALLAGCGTASSSSAVPAVAVDHGALAPLSAQSGSLGTTTTSGGPGAPAPAVNAIVVGTPGNAQIERSVTAVYTVPEGSFLGSFEGTIGRAVGLGGYVVSSNTQPDNSGRIVSGSVTLKVPAAKVADFLNGMPTGFTASSINFASIDHTAAFVDVNAQLTSARAHLDALDLLLSKATSLGDITNLEQQIETVQAEINTDQGQLNLLTASVELATATVQMSERGAQVAQPAPPGPVSGGLAGGWSNAVQVTGAVLEALVSALPLLVLVVLALLVWRRLPRSLTSRRRPQAAD